MNRWDQKPHGRLARLVIAVSMAVPMIGIFSPSNALANHVTPQEFDGNKSCGQLNPNWVELIRIQPVHAGTFTSGSTVITLSNTKQSAGDVVAFDWSSNTGIDGVFVKGGPGGNLYTYNEALSDTGLKAPDGKGISHISFCADIEPPQINIDKTGPAAANRGDTITYTMKVTIPGSVPLTSVVVTDPKCDVAPTLQSKTGGDQDDTLEVNEVWTYTCPHLITNSDPDPLPNTATATGRGPNNEQVSDTDDHLVDIAAIIPLINIDKTGPATANRGDTITYTMKVTIPGNVSLTNVSVSDPKCDSTPVLQSKTGGDQDDALEQGEVWTYTCPHLITSTDPDPLPNTATARGTGGLPAQEVTDTDDHVVDVAAVIPLINIDKTGPATANRGDTITYTMKVTIPGNVPLTNVSVSDPKCNSAPTLQSKTGGDQDDTLEAGEVWTYTCPHLITTSDPDPLPNTATARGTGGSPSQEVTDTDDHLVDIAAAAAPVINIVKTGPAEAKRGDTITYTMTVTIPSGSVPLTNVTVTDPKCNSAPTLQSKTGGDQDNTLEAGEVWTYTCPHLITDSDPDPLPNTATATGTGPNNEQVTDTDDHLVDIVPVTTVNPQINIVKDGPQEAEVGDTITYTMTVTLPVDVPLTNVTVTDPRCDDAPVLQSKASGDQDDVLEFGEVWTYTCRHRITNSDPNPLPNTATATGTGPQGQQVSDQDSHLVDLVPNPRIKIEKDGPQSAKVGDTITYVLEVSIPVDRPLHDVNVSDPKCDGQPKLDSKLGGDSDGLLEFGEVWIYTCDHKVTSSDVGVLKNTADVSGKDEKDKKVTDKDTHVVDVTEVRRRIIEKPPPPSGPLPFTGYAATHLLLVALVLLTAGTLSLIVSGRKPAPARRRRRR